MNELYSSRIKLSQLRAFVAVAHCGNFGEAALHLEISQSAVSHAIASLEEELGVSLLLRGRLGARLTVAGEKAVIYARQSLELLEAMVGELNSHKGLEGGQVRLAAFRSVSTHILPKIITEFRDRFPKITVSVLEYFDYSEVDQALRAGQADVGFTYLPAGEEFEIYPIYRDEYLVFLPPTARLPEGPLSWKELMAYPYISVIPGNACHTWIERHLYRQGVSLRAAFYVKEDSTMMGMVAQGLGIAILPQLAAEPIPPAVQVRSLPIPLDRSIGAATLVDTLHPPAVFAFLELLRSSSLNILPLTSRLSA
jgi:DNA-binding transcriptional LysR family regulator